MRTFFPCRLCTGTRAADDAPAHVLVAQEALPSRSPPWTHALQCRQSDDQQISRLEDGLVRQAHIGCTSGYALGRRHIAFVGTGHQHEAAIARRHIFQGPEYAHALAEAPSVLKVIGGGRIARFVASGQRRVGRAALLAPDFRLPVQDESRSDELVEMLHQVRVHQKVAEGFF